MSTQPALSAQVEEEAVETGLEQRDTRALAEHLSGALADTYILYLQSLGTHWNVVGPTFYGLHKLTEEQYEDLHQAADDIAERIRALGQIAPSSFGEFERHSALDSEPARDTAEDMVRDLVKNHQVVADRMRGFVKAAEEADDVYTADLLTARIGVHEEAAWMLRSLLAR